MIIVRGDRFIKKGEKLYIAGSASNEFYRLTTMVMGKVKLMGWLIDNETYDIRNLEEFNNKLDIGLILNPQKMPFITKMNVIRKTVRHADCISVKMGLPASIIGCIFALIYRIPFVLESGSDSKTSLWYHSGLSYKLSSYPVEWLVKFLHRRSKHIIYVSRFFLQKKYPSKARQMGVSDTILTTPPLTILNKRISRIECSENDYVLGLIGATHVEYRGHDTLIKVAAKLTEKGYNIKVRFLGGGTGDDKRLDLARSLGIENIIEFSGRKKHDDVLTWIDDIDVLVMPTLQETLGRAIIEAMSRGCPVVGSIETAIGEQIGSDCLVHARNIDEIVETIERIISNKSYAVACAKENFYRSFKYNSDYTYSLRKKFYDEFYKIEKISKQ